VAGGTHTYELDVEWTGNRGAGTSGYRAYDRDHVIDAPGKDPIAGSADPAFRGARARWNPEELLVASLAQCHMLWYLHLAASAGVVVTAYRDRPTGTMVEDSDSAGGGQFAEVTLRPHVIVTDPAMLETARRVHDDVGTVCFVARSVNFPVHHEPAVQVGEHREWPPDGHPRADLRRVRG